MAERPLPGMPLGADDVFVCTGIGDEPLHSIVPVQRPPALRDAWLVLLFCERCLYRNRRYCSQHNEANWWLANWGTLPASPARARSSGGR